MENALRYHAEIDLSQKNTAQAQLIRLTGRNKDVLEVGPATGYVTKLLQQRGCRVCCVEIDPEAADVAAPFCLRMVVDNIETIDLESTFPHARFDVVTFGDVLEHLIDPLGVLVRVKDLLKPGGYVVASVPNVAHGSIRLSLLAGRFDYLEKGLLDRTHLRFFTLESLGDLFKDAGYWVRSWRRVLADPFATEVELREDEYPPHLVEAARGDLGGLTYQFVVKAYPLGTTPNGRSLPTTPSESGRNLLDYLWRWENELREKDLALAETSYKLTMRERSLQEANAHLSAVYGSLGYTLLETLRRRGRKLLPESSLLGWMVRILVSLAKRAISGGRRKRSPPSAHLLEEEHGGVGDGP